MIGRCPACPAKDAQIAAQQGTLDAQREDIAFLRGQVTDLQKKLIEVASPGANARAAWTPPPPREKAERRFAGSYSPRRLAQVRADRPAPRVPEDKPTSAALTAQQIEDSFRRSDG